MKDSKWLILIFLLPMIVFSQEPMEQVPLKKFLAETETKFNVKFSYTEQDVESVRIAPPPPNLDIQQTVDYLNARTVLKFKILNHRYIAVSIDNRRIAICGRIWSRLEGAPLFGASISVLGSSTGAVSDIEGKFTLERVPLNSQIEISYLGYTPIQMRASLLIDDSSECTDIFLSESSEILNQILITKFLTTGMQKMVDGSTTLNTEKFGILPGLIEPDILQSIQALPGVESRDESIANINVRGGTNDQNLIIWDHIRMYHSGHFFGLISAFNPNLTRSVKVTKNGTSSEFSDGVSSTVNMYTLDELSEEWAGGAGVNFISGDAFMQIPLHKKLELHLSARRSFTDVLATPTYDNYFDRSFQDSDIITTESGQTSSDFYFYDFTAKLLYNINRNHKLRVNAIGISNYLDYSEEFAEDEGDLSKASSLSQENLGFGVNWGANWYDQFKTQFSAYYSQYNIDAEDFRIDPEQTLAQANEVLETGIKVKSNWAISRRLNLMNGYQFNETGIVNKTLVSNPSYYREKKDVLLNHAFFSEIEYNFKDTYLRAGVRFNYFQKFQKLIIEPRLNLRQKINNNLAVRLEGEFKNQTATQVVDFQDDFLGVENRRWVLANNQDIPITISKQGSVGLEFQRNNLHLELTGFYKVVDGIIARNQGFYNNFQFLNAQGKYVARGAEFLANKTATNYSAWLSYTYSLNDYDFASFDPSIFPNNVDIRHSLSLAFNYDIIENLQISLGGIWRSGLPYTIPIEGNETIQDGNTVFVNYDRPNTQNLDYFFRLDGSVKYKQQFRKGAELSLTAGLRNITNRENFINRYYEVNPEDSNLAVSINNRSLGLTPNLSMRYQF